MEEGKRSLDNYAPFWERIRKELSKGEMSADKVAVLEAEKLLRKALEEKGLPGKDAEDRIRSYTGLFRNPDKLKYSRAMHRKIIEKAGFDISPEDAQEIIKGYYEAIVDIANADLKALPFKDKLGLFLKRNFNGFPRNIKKIFLAVIAVSIFTFILTETESGRSISAYLVDINNYFFYRIIPALLILIVLAAMLIGALYAYRGRKK